MAPDVMKYQVFLCAGRYYKEIKKYKNSEINKTLLGDKQNPWEINRTLRDKQDP
jgi:hypothetical protein